MAAINALPSLNVYNSPSADELAQTKYAAQNQLLMNQQLNASMAEKTAAADRTRRLNELYRKHVDPATGQLNRNALMGALAQGNMGSAIPQLQETFGKVDEQTAKASKALTDSRAAALTAHRSRLSSVRTPDQALQWVLGQFKDPVLSEWATEQGATPESEAAQLLDMVREMGVEGTLARIGMDMDKYLEKNAPKTTSVDLMGKHVLLSQPGLGGPVEQVWEGEKQPYSAAVQADKERAASAGAAGGVAVYSPQWGQNEKGETVMISPPKVAGQPPSVIKGVASPEQAKQIREETGVADAMSNYTSGLRKSVQSLRDDKDIGYATGWLSLLPTIPETDQARVKSKMRHIDAATSIDKINEMRQMSKTGGAVGQVTEAEWDRLRDAAEALAAAQKKEDYIAALQRFDDQLARIENLIAEGRKRIPKIGGGQSAADASAPIGAAPSKGWGKAVAK